MRPAPSAYWREIATGRRRDPIAFLLVAFLLPISLLYAMLLYLRSSLYRVGILTSRKLPRPVISIGNITVGGTGKTPVTSYIACLLMNRGFKVAVLSRGYGGSLEGQTAVVADGNSILVGAEQCGDEPYLLASQLPGLIVVIGTDRYAAGLLAMKQFSPDIFLLDDGFQHLCLKRDMNILLLDACIPFGNHFTLPAGLLREPVSAAGRADLIIHTRCPEGLGVQHPLPGKPNIAARHKIKHLVPFLGGTATQLSELHGKKVMAFAAIAEPLSFFDGLRAQGIELAKCVAFPDHATYTPDKLAEIMAAVQSLAVDHVIITAKDAVKLKGLPAELAKLIYVACLELALDDAEILDKQLINLLQNQR